MSKYRCSKRHSLIGKIVWYTNSSGYNRYTRAQFVTPDNRVWGLGWYNDIARARKNDLLGLTINDFIKSLSGTKYHRKELGYGKNVFSVGLEKVNVYE